MILHPIAVTINGKSTGQTGPRFSIQETVEEVLFAEHQDDWFPEWPDPIIVFFCECGQYWSELEDAVCPCDYIPFPTVMSLREYVAADAPRWVVFV